MESREDGVLGRDSPAQGLRGVGLWEAGRRGGGHRGREGPLEGGGQTEVGGAFV